MRGVSVAPGSSCIHVVLRSDPRVSRPAAVELAAFAKTLELECDEGPMSKARYCVYNRTRECFLSLGVTAADTAFARLRGLIGKLRLSSDEGVWVIPSQGIHTLGVLFPLDLIYLDDDLKVIHTVEHFPTFRIAPIKTKAASVLELPAHAIYSSQTQPGDQLVICRAEEITRHLSEAETRSTEVTTA